MSQDFTQRLQAALDPAYTLEHELTGGGMSRVFVARETSLGRTVVVKVLPPELAAGVSVERFRREIQLAAQLHHPHIVPLLSAGEADGLLYYTMPFIDGESLRHTIERRGRLPVRETVRILHNVVDALAYAHGRGIVHRDIKPGNVLLQGNHALLTDFGVAKALSAALPISGVTTAGVAIGTPAYMAPEQLAGDPTADHRVDIYAVGLLAYELLTGASPFTGPSPAATLAAQLTRVPEPLHVCCPDVPPALSAVLMRCLEKTPEQRPQSAAELLAELDELPTLAASSPLVRDDSGVTGATTADATRRASGPTSGERAAAAAAAGSAGSVATDETAAVADVTEGEIQEFATSGGRRARRAAIAGVLTALLLGGVAILSSRPSGERGVPAVARADTVDSAAVPAASGRGRGAGGNGASRGGRTATRAPRVNAPGAPDAAPPTASPAASRPLTFEDSLRIAEAIRARMEKSTKPAVSTHPETAAAASASAAARTQADSLRAIFEGDFARALADSLRIANEILRRRGYAGREPTILRLDSLTRQVDSLARLRSRVYVTPMPPMPPGVVPGMPRGPRASARGPAAAMAPLPALPSPARVAVASFANSTRHRELDGLRGDIAEGIRDALDAEDGFAVVDEDEARDAAARSAGSRWTFGLLTHADLVVTGTYYMRGDSVVATVIISEVGRQRVLGSFESAAAALDDTDPVVESVASRIVPAVRQLLAERR